MIHGANSTTPPAQLRLKDRASMHRRLCITVWGGRAAIISRVRDAAFSSTPYGDATATGSKTRESVLHEKKGIDRPAI